MAGTIYTSMSHMSDLYLIFHSYKIGLSLLACLVAILFIRMIWPTTLFKNLHTHFGTNRIETRSLSPYLNSTEEKTLPLDAGILEQESKGVRQPYDVFLVLDVEATCAEGSNFNYPNEIIELPVCLLRWTDKDENGMASTLECADEFRSFVRPTWRPQLSEFCTGLTGITQDQVDSAPHFKTVLRLLREFLVKNGLIHRETGHTLTRFCWCSDGPYDIRDFIVKQCFISKIPIPPWISADVMDVRNVVSHWQAKRNGELPHRQRKPKNQILPRRQPFSLPRQLHALGLDPFEGRQHSGIDDTRNISRIVVELARRGVRLESNTSINPNRRWTWMGKQGKILEEYCT